MSFVELRVELPAYAHSFVITVPSTCTIAYVKQEIERSCIGGPRPDGQRIICRGRYLVDRERVDEVWKSPEDPRFVHLAVHPSAWSSSPPTLPSSILSTSNPAPLPPTPTTAPVATAPSQRPITMGTVSQALHPLTYILHKHQTALSALTQGALAYGESNISPEILRPMSIQAVEAYGWSWPAMLDEVFPPETPGGLLYDCVTIDGQPFLSLRTPGSPTERQSHALKVLTYTFTLLSIPISNVTTTPTITSQYVPMPPNVNQLLQQLDLTEVLAARNAQNPPPNQLPPGLREMPLRPLFAPMMLLLFRTLLLLYFVAPARKPIFGILIILWMLYEIWRPIRNAFIRNWQRAAAVDHQRRQNVPVAQPAREPAAGDVPQPAQNAPVAGIPPTDVARQGSAILEVLGNQNIAAEEGILNDIRGINPPEPTTRHKLVTFFGLLFMTIHPAVWNRRRVALGRREGRIRTEAHVRNAAPSEIGNEDGNRAGIRTELQRQYAQRPQWVREYIERVVVGDWVDDSD